MEELQSWEESPAAAPISAPQVWKILINVTQVCNLHCRYCAAAGDGTYGDPQTRISVEKTIPQLYTLMKKVPAGGTFQIHFMGGEPLLYPEGLRLLAAAAREFAEFQGIRLRFAVITNGTLLNERTIPVLEELRAHVVVSLDGPASINDRTRPGRGGVGSTERVIEGLNRLLARRARLGGVSLGGVFSRFHDGMDFAELYDFYSSFPVDSFDVDFDVNESSEERSRAYVAGLAVMAERAFAKGGEKELRRIEIFDKHFHTLDQRQPVVNYCNAGKTTFAMDAKNRLYPCPWMVGEKDEIVGQARELWPERLKAYKEAGIQRSDCSNCWARFLCGGGCHKVHKRFSPDREKNDPAFCERTRQVAELALLYYYRCRATIQ